MKRKFLNGEAYNGEKAAFVGTEIEHNEYFGLRTLFVTRLLETKEIIGLAVQHDVEIIYFDYNYGYPQERNAATRQINWFAIDKRWRLLVNTPIDEMSYINKNINDAVHRVFVLPHHAYTNTSLKFEGIRGRCKGVVTINVNNLNIDEHFTEWSEYDNDIIVKE